MWWGHPSELHCLVQPCCALAGRTFQPGLSPLPPGNPLPPTHPPTPQLDDEAFRSSTQWPCPTEAGAKVTCEVQVSLNATG